MDSTLTTQTRQMPRPGLSAQIAPMTIGALMHEFARFDPQTAAAEYPWADRFVMGFPLAPWQREFKWSVEQVERFITSVWAGVHLGTYCLTEYELSAGPDGKGVVYDHLSNCVIDGQQRLKALELYLTDQVAVPDVQGAPCTWSEVDPVDRRRFERTHFSRGVLRERDEATLRSAYDLMNFSGLPHAEHERASRPASGGMRMRP